MELTKTLDDITYQLTTNGERALTKIRDVQTIRDSLNKKELRNNIDKHLLSIFDIFQLLVKFFDNVEESINSFYRKIQKSFKEIEKPSNDVFEIVHELKQQVDNIMFLFPQYKNCIQKAYDPVSKGLETSYTSDDELPEFSETTIALGHFL